MVIIKKNSNKIAYGIKHFNVDTVAEIADINLRYVKPGSTVFVIEGSLNYVLNSEYQWVLTAANGGGNSNGSNITIENWTSAEDNPIPVPIPQLVINKVDSQQVYNNMKAANLIDENEIYLVEDENNEFVDEDGDGVLDQDGGNIDDEPSNTENPELDQDGGEI